MPTCGDLFLGRAGNFAAIARPIFQELVQDESSDRVGVGECRCHGGMRTLGRIVVDAIECGHAGGVHAKIHRGVQLEHVLQVDLAGASERSERADAAAVGDGSGGEVTLAPGPQRNPAIGPIGAFHAMPVSASSEVGTLEYERRAQSIGVAFELGAVQLASKISTYQDALLAVSSRNLSTTARSAARNRARAPALPAFI